MGDTMKIKIKFFASIREIVGKNEIEIEINSNTKVGDVIENLKLQFPKLKKVESTTIIVLNHNIANLDKEVKEGDVLALFPPVSGG